MARKLLEIKESQVKKTFEAVTDIPLEEIVDILEMFPFDRHITIHTKDRTFGGMLTYNGRLIKK